MNYGELVEKNAQAFLTAGYLKMAKDLAKLLDAKEFSVEDIERWGHNTCEFVKVREEVFNKFCAVCLVAGLELPPIEKEFYMAPILVGGTKASKDVAVELKRINKHVLEQLRGNRSKNARLCRSLQSVMDLFPGSGLGRFNEDKMSAMINFLLISEDCKPVRPDYAKINLYVPDVKKQQADVSVLIVDDDKKVALQTAAALAGLPHASVEFYFYSSERSWKKLEGVKKEEALTVAAKEIIKKNTHIMLMDQGLGDIEGSDLIRKIKNLSVEPQLFVANTGGDDEELRDAGALNNCNKGKNLTGVIQAMEMWN